MTTAEEFRTRILAAARLCYIEQPSAERMHTLIAERAGVSRPTVYKYLGDQAAIKRALMRSEAMDYLVALQPAFARRLPLREHFRELVVFTVSYFRGNDLFRAMLEAAPEELARSLTIDLAPVLAEGTGLAAPLLHAIHPATADSPVPIELVLEWGVRVSLSLATMPSPNRELDSPEAIAAHVDALFAIAATPAG
ncbi:TetR/AcrR family transcriptional regulator [Nocardia cyriacigeorgica]|uniref:TetR/AcrR family transcriptional regulator n=1 Tax=Nocardia cyriacigeorgica TaxID=135487 RepID=UPI0018944D91|nr:TetR/AcrR family transcriptional regulator [Nocardia cyriacigeorgica]MBF6435316.1 TetR/AcrR family transcriptional regulator [Nocardia cyriacigeorgica]MBF6454603.1 TetR/AcrR family transcriptional regulator [Nocardia cyriacigeorgica]MBF6479678.1 TetR/AcrR family transcriptional regulator [Nocardia cyriacigeorgica]MBF6552497.1 TetR/AcrR family transcriptional regulator [Nocardia cyriacigeorgica]